MMFKECLKVILILKCSDFQPNNVKLKLSPSFVSFFLTRTVGSKSCNLSWVVPHNHKLSLTTTHLPTFLFTNSYPFSIKNTGSPSYTPPPVHGPPFHSLFISLPVLAKQNKFPPFFLLAPRSEITHHPSIAIQDV
jgi:hypothetical protein